ncbi:MAG: hypothetical protein MASP_01517 [Candidatus Methanolliviera sp. GoM_asphalt]|nr:MAG: hypothetical protein MASP_01517 [Candidatus Methanolliviera sp. GoM_asphalt]
MEEREREMRRLILYAVNGFAQNSFYDSLTSFLNRRGVAVKDIIEFLSEYGEDISMVDPIIKDLIADGCLKQTDQNTMMSSYPPLSVPENDLFTKISKSRVDKIKNYRPRTRKRRGEKGAKKS